MQDHLSDMLAMVSLMHTGFLLPFWPRGLINSTIPLTTPFTAGATPHPCPASRHKVLFFLWGWSTNLVRKGEGAQVGAFHKKCDYTLEQVTQDSGVTIPGGMFSKDWTWHLVLGSR